MNIKFARQLVPESWLRTIELCTSSTSSLALITVCDNKVNPKFSTVGNYRFAYTGSRISNTPELYYSLLVVERVLQYMVVVPKCETS
jgi:hypothetical protein